MSNITKEQADYANIFYDKGIRPKIIFLNGMPFSFSQNGHEYIGVRYTTSLVRFREKQSLEFYNAFIKGVKKEIFEEQMKEIISDEF
jgi:hypothetical protein